MVRYCSARYIKSTHKFRIKLPKMVQDAYTMDAKIGSTLWQDTNQKEMENIKNAFQIIHKAKKPPNDFNTSTSTWCLTLKWSVSIERHASWLEAILLIQRCETHGLTKIIWHVCHKFSSQIQQLQFSK